MYLIAEGSHGKKKDVYQKINVPDVSSQEFPMIYFHPDEKTSEWIYRNDVCEKPLIYWAIENYGGRGKTFVDIGAHLGIYTWTMARHFHHVYAFECHPKTFCYLAANVALHDVCDKTTLYNCALSNREEKADYFIRNNDGGENGLKMLSTDEAGCKKIPVQTRTLDSFGIDNIGLIKIDVEGFEKEVVEGSIKTLARNNYPPIIFESWDEHRIHYIPKVKELRNDLFTLFTMIGYKIQPLGGGFGEIFLATK